MNDCNKYEREGFFIKRVFGECEEFWTIFRDNH